MNFLIIFLGLLNYISKIEMRENCSLENKEHFIYFNAYTNNNLTMIIQNFNKFDELNFNCKNLTLTVTVVVILPNREILLDNTVTFIRLVNLVKYVYNKNIVFNRINGFNLKLYKKPNYYYKGYEILFENSRFDFYIDGSKINEKNCKLSNFNQTFNIFGPILALTMNSNNFYSKNTCPYVFMNSEVQRITLSEISNSLILKNQLEFTHINQENTFNLNNRNLFYLNMGFAFEFLTTKTVNIFVFKYVERIYIWGVVDGIQLDFFKYFKHLKFVFVYLQNFERFLQASDNKWMTYLNMDVKVNLNKLNQVNSNLGRTILLELVQKNGDKDTPSTFTRAYMYPDEDFCLFKYFPHQQLVYPLIVSSAKIECTCTLLWLLKYSNLYFENNYKTLKVYSYIIDYVYTYGDEYANHSGIGCLGKDLDKRIRSCNFEERLKNCNKSNLNHKSTNQIISSDLQVFFLFKWFELVLLEFLQPTLCIFGIVTNSLTILTVKQSIGIGKVKDPLMYNHIFYNSIFNLIYCIISLFSLINVCIFTQSTFCSSLYTYHASQYFKIVFIYYFGNAIKLCCNISYTTFAISRFALASNKKTGVYKKLNDLNLRRYYAIVFMLSLAFSTFKLFEYRINEIYYQLKQFPFDKYDVDHCNEINDYCTAFKILNVVNNFIKDILFIIVNLILDIAIVRITTQNLELKKKIADNSKNLSQAHKNKDKMIQMVIINCFIFIISYLPELTARLLLYSLNAYLYLFCFEYLSCKELVELAECFNFILIGLQFFIFKHFNKAFYDKFEAFKTKFYKLFRIEV